MMQLEPSPLPPPPRAVRRKAGTGCGLGIIRLILIPHTLFGLYLLLQIPQRLYVYYRGTPVVAVVNYVEAKTSKKGGDYYTLHYEYRLSGRRYEYEKSANVDAGMRTHAGQTLDGHAAAFLGRSLFLPAGTDVPGEVPTMLTMASLWNAFMSFIMYAAWIAPLRQRRIIARGECAVGSITGRKKVTGRSPSFNLVYNFTAADGQSYTGKCVVTESEFQFVPDGSTVFVLYDPARPRRNLSYQHGDFVVIGPAMR